MIRDDELALRVAAGDTLQELAKRFGCTSLRVFRRIRLAGIPWTWSTPNPEAQARGRARWDRARARRARALELGR